MTSQSPISNNTLKSMDNSAVVHFLSQIGASMVEHGLLDRSDVEEFRIVVQQTKSLGNEAAAKYPLVRLADQSLNLMSAITEHFGNVGFSRNLLRYSMRECSRQLANVLREIISLTVDQSALLFNRPFALYLDQECDRLTLFSTPLLEIGESCESALGIIDIATTKIARLIPSDFPSDSNNRHEIDTQIAKNLEFILDTSSGSSLAAESLSSDLIFASVRHVGKCIGAFAEQLKWNLAADNTGKLRLACEFLINQSLTSSTFRDSTSSDLQTWEHKRQNWTEVFHQIVRGLEDIRLALKECLSLKANIKAPEGAVLARNVGRMVSADLMKSGVNPVRAQQASKDLLEYCKNGKIRPSQVISGELSKINPSLNHSALSALQSTDRDPNLLFASVNEKSANYRTMERLKGMLANSAVVLLAIIGAFTTNLSSCGLKGDPKSQLEEPRPEIPFHPQATPTASPKAP